MNILTTRGRYYPSTCPICSNAALAAEAAHHETEIQCAACGAFEITAAARSAMKGLSAEGRSRWLAQARQQACTMPLIACVNETRSHAAALSNERAS